ncbi:MAG: hypothetical protein EP319_17450 [Deltaproteobacteria bacterium]|nr:MAG: hypothetical protein EP319_17450 [Deltaproteobacteria bacterium]
MSKSFVLIMTFLFVLSACMPTTPKSNRKNTSSNTSTDGASPPPAAPPSDFGGSMYWYSGSTTIPGTITLKADTQTVVYLRGSLVHQFLDSVAYYDSFQNKNIYQYDKSFCIVANYEVNSTKVQLRARAVPIDFYNFSAKSKERLFRIDIPKKDDNTNACQGLKFFYNEAGQTTSYPGQVHYSPLEFCPNCNSKFSSLSIQLYESSGGFLSPNIVDTSKFSLDSVGLKIDTANAYNDTGDQCSISSCQAKGFDCCLDGQCVNDGSLRTNATLDPLYSQAMSDVSVNPLNFINYPTIFYVCTNMPRPTPTPTPTTNPNEEADAVFQRELNEYLCLEEGKKDNPDFAVGTCDITPKKAESYFQDIKFYYKVDGLSGNGYNIEYVGGGTAGAEVVTENSVFRLQIKIQDGVTTANDIINTLNTYVNLGNFLQVNYILTGLPSRIQNIGAASPLAGGADPNNDTSLNKAYCESNGGVWKFNCVIGKCSNEIFSNKFDCESNSETWTATYTNEENANGTQLAHNSIRSNVWDRCGCEADPFPTDPDAPQCPDFGLKAVKDASGKITDIICLVPNANAEPTPFQNLSLSVPSRSAPHRFYDQDGTSHDDLKDLKGRTDISQEGEAFSYTDESGKTGPIPTTFSVNAIFGQMTLELNRALPAKMIGVEFDQTYIISTTNGFYTPCPTCATDQWFEAFKPFPPSQKGNGLAPIGFITDRSSYSNNLSLGNYEDTAFGRACWVPPTMLPWSHSPNTVLKDQRTNRLETQASMWVNGYQRDWFGFNQGALIGSFDGVTWFAVGDGRRVTATSNKLFLAINAPFADLAEPTDLTVSIVQDMGTNTVADYDYDPELPMDHPEQNHGATCRNFHQCSTDSDCVTSLGWEYVCGDILDYRSNWPKFDIDGNEIADTQRPSQMWTQILNGLKIGSNTKRCIYRGAGAPCMTDWSGETKSKQKQIRCAPNFYCSTLENTDFNKEVVRTPNLVEVILYGQDADVLGRPLSYLSSNSSLSSNTRDAIIANAATFTTSGGTMGLCRPGKALSNITTTTKINTQHSSRDPGGRTDYISQISSCNSDTTGEFRTISCPVFDMNPDSDTFGDYIYHEEQFSATNTGIIGTNNSEITVYRTLSSQQNMCGAESQLIESGELVSTFKEIEAEDLSGLANLLFPKIVRNACLRKAGNVCHTDLDCGPNRLHADQAQFLGPEKFGNTAAEKEYWQEGLICSQSAYKPQLNTEAFGNYDMTLNRCCREIGSDLSMYTQYSRADGTIIQSTDAKLVESIFGGNERLRVMSTPAQALPSSVGRYSRYSSFSITDNAIALNAAPLHQAPIIELDTSGIPATPKAPKPFQWKTINDTGRNSCCGNGWVRKFADGTNDWTNRQRLNFDYTSLNCLNYRSPLPFERPMGINANNYQKDVDKLCLSPGEFGCVQYPLDRKEINILFGTASAPYETYEEAEYLLRRPGSVVTTSPYGAAGVLETFPSNDPNGGTLEQRKNHHAIYQPVPFNTPSAYNDGLWNFMASQTFNYGASFFLPSYIQKDNITRVDIVYFKDGVAIEEASTAKGLSCDDETSGDCVIELGGNCTVNASGSHTKRGCLNNGGSWVADGTCNINIRASVNIRNETRSFPRPNQPNTGAGTGNTVEEAAFCIKNEGNYDVFHYGGRQVLPAPILSDWQYGGVRIVFNPINSPNFEVCHSGAPNYTILDQDRAGCAGAGGTWQALSAIPDQTKVPLVTNPGNSLYYTSKLARLELLGIPQIAYEPIYCNSDYTEVIPGIFESGLETRTQWQNDANAFDYTGSSTNGLFPDAMYTPNRTLPTCGDTGCPPINQRAVLKDKVKLADIWSENEFQCCRETNLETDSAGNCCSGFASDINGVLTCKLPPGTNLNLFFNKFVSGEGMSDYIEENTRLKDTDFVPETGEPKLNDDVEQKLVNLGALFCSSGNVRAGATDGFFYAEPNNERYYHQTQVDEEQTKYRGLIDTNLDFDGDNDTGAFRFNEGFRWSHHIYCQ